MTIVASSWSRRPKTEVKIEPPEKIVVEKGFEDKKVEPEYLTEQIPLQDENNIPDLETLESSYPEEEKIQLENIVQTESIKQKGVIRKISKPQIVKSEPKIEIEPKKEREETIEIDTIEPIIIDESELDTSLTVSIEDQPNSLLEQQTVEIESIYPLILEDKEEKDLSDLIKVEPVEIQKQEEALIEPVDEIELPSFSDEAAKTTSAEIEQEKEKLEEAYLEPISEVIEKEVEIGEPRARRRVRKPVIDESDPDLKIDLGVETCPHCGSKVPNTIYCIYCGKSLETGEDSKQE
jgi:hypothetical protein